MPPVVMAPGYVAVVKVLVLAAAGLLCMATRDIPVTDRKFINVLEYLSEKDKDFLMTGMDRPSECEVHGAAEAVDWMNRHDVTLAEKLGLIKAATWNHVTNITEANDAKVTEVTAEVDDWLRERVEEARTYLDFPRSFRTVSRQRRRLTTWLHGHGRDVPVAIDLNKARRMTSLQTELETIQGEAVVKRWNQSLHLEPELTHMMATSRDYALLQIAWDKWHDVTGYNTRLLFEEMVDVMNEAAEDNDFTDAGQFWRVKHYGKDDIEQTADDLYRQMEPLYTELMTYVKRKLVAVYQRSIPHHEGPLPAHVLGSMWGEQWENIFELVAPFADVPSYDVTAAMLAQGYTVPGMFKLAESFFTSLGLEPMTETFWEKSMFERPADRAVQCHASAEDFLSDDDFRIKMCSEVKMADLLKAHRQMAHVAYAMQYKHQPTAFRAGANAAFPEALAGAISLSAGSTGHLHTVGLLRASDLPGNNKERELTALLRVALREVPRLTFSYLLEKWRWEVFRGNITCADYNKKWWEYRTRYQRVAPPVARCEEDFDPGSEYHVATGRPQLRVFLGGLAGFQFYKSLCGVARHAGPLHRCDIYGSPAVGNLLKVVLGRGSSQLWPEAMDKLTDEQDFTADAMLEYFSPLYKWLQHQNKQV